MHLLTLVNLDKNQDAMVEKEKMRNELDSVKRELSQAASSSLSQHSGVTGDR